MKHLLWLFVATFSVASADVTLGKELKQGVITVMEYAPPQIAAEFME
jgi:hypothetical protein